LILRRLQRGSRPRAFKTGPEAEFFSSLLEPRQARWNREVLKTSVKRFPAGTAFCAGLVLVGIRLYVGDGSCKSNDGDLQLKCMGCERWHGVHCKSGQISYRLYTEVRYHYAPTKYINTQFMALTLGVRY
jgi:hypothetical protein